jgi:histidyl-tRNA synthetase
MEDKNLFPTSLKASSDVLFVNFGPAEALACIAMASEIRSVGFSAEVYPDEAKLKKQMKYADSKGIRFVMMVGTEELANKQVTVKDMITGEQHTVFQKDISSFVIDKHQD